MHWLGDRQSAADWHGNAHLLYCVLQWCVPQDRSFWHGSARGPGTAIVLAVAVGAGATAGAGAVGGGAGYWPGAYVGAAVGCG
jgi:hypothetical protein